MKIAVADVETTMITPGVRPTTLFWGLQIEGEKYRRFATSQKLWVFLATRSPLRIYCHTQFDMLQLMSEGFGLRVKDVRSGRILRALGPFGRGSKEHEWRDSHALFPAKLAEILECSGFVKPGLDDLEERNRADTRDALVAFRQLAKEFEGVFGIDPLDGKSLTASSVTFRAAQEAAGKLPRHLMHRNAYRGGRVEAFRLGACGMAEQWDVCSSYPASFVDLPQSDTLYFADVVVSEDKGPCPFFRLEPHAERGKLLFPRGRFRTAFWGSTYERYIQPHGGIESIRLYDRVECDLSWIKRLVPLIEGAYRLRAAAKKEGNSALAFALKIGLNSIYGRLGLKSERELCTDGPTVAAGEDVIVYELVKGERFLSFKKVPSNPAANYLFAGAITCNARGRLYDGLRRAGEGLYYCDTDSVFCAPGSIDFQSSKALGEWQYEGTQPLYIHSVKDYVWGDKVALKGGESYLRWTLKAMAAGKMVREIRRTRTSSYDKRYVLPSGETTPLEFWE